MASAISLHSAMKFLVSLLVLLACAAQSFAVLERLDDGSVVDDEPFQYWYKDEEGNLHVRDPKIVDESGANLLLREDVSKRVQFYLFTRSSPTYYERQELFVDDVESLRKSKFDVKKPTRFVTHGWTQSTTYPVCTLIRDAFLKKGDYNVILVDWSSISQSLYSYAQPRVKLVGERVARMIDFLVKNGLDASNIHLIGHSLGAHIMGLAGHQSTNKVAYINGMDPAGPGFNFARPGSRIAKGDARSVQIIHTNGGGMGIRASIGDIDFFPNGGTFQSGCGHDLSGVCDHNRSFLFVAESINSPKGFWATECTSFSSYNSEACRGNAMTIMAGANPDVSSTGNFYLHTERQSPFARGKIGASI